MRGRIVSGLAVAIVVAMAGNASACFLGKHNGGCYGGGCYGGGMYTSGGCYGGYAYPGQGAGTVFSSGLAPQYGTTTYAGMPYYESPGVVVTGGAATTTTTPSNTVSPATYTPSVSGDAAVKTGVYMPAVGGSTVVPAGYSTTNGTASGSLYWNGSSWAPMTSSGGSYVTPGYSYATPVWGGGYSGPGYYGGRSYYGGGYYGGRGYYGGTGAGFGGRWR